MGEKHRMTHTQTFFPESLILDVIGRSPGLRLVVDLPIPILGTVVLQITTSFLAYSCGYSLGFEPNSLLMRFRKTKQQPQYGSKDKGNENN